jgi:5'-3' exonuclease
MSAFFLTSNSLLFTFTSYLVSSVIEEEESKTQDENGNDVVLPTNMAGPNPNDVEFDNLYLDMNGIVSLFILPPLSDRLVERIQVHPCTHPEGKVRTLSTDNRSIYLTLTTYSLRQRQKVR